MKNIKVIVLILTIIIAIFLLISATSSNLDKIGKFQMVSHETSKGYIMLIMDTETGVAKELYLDSKKNQLGKKFEDMDDLLK